MLKFQGKICHQSRRRFFFVLFCGCLSAFVLAASPLADAMNRYICALFLTQTGEVRFSDAFSSNGTNKEPSRPSLKPSVVWRKYSAQIIRSVDKSGLPSLFPGAIPIQPSVSQSEVSEALNLSKDSNTTVYIGFSAQDAADCQFIFFPGDHILLHLDSGCNGQGGKPVWARRNLRQGPFEAFTAWRASRRLPIEVSSSQRRPSHRIHLAAMDMSRLGQFRTIQFEGGSKWIQNALKVNLSYPALNGFGLAATNPTSLKLDHIFDLNSAGLETGASKAEPNSRSFHFREIPRCLVWLGGIIVGIFSGLLFLLFSPYQAMGIIAALLVSGFVGAFVSFRVFWFFPLAELFFFLSLPALFSGSYLYGLEHRHFMTLQRFFKRYVNADVMRTILDNPRTPSFGGKKVRATFMFTDIRDFTMISEQLEPQEILCGLNRYFAAMTKVVIETQGYLCRYIGDGIFAVFGSTDRLSDDGAYAAVCCGLKMLKALEGLNQEKLFPGCDQIHIGIGIHTGDTVAGNVGCDAKMEYTFYGDTVNLASRIEGATKGHDTPLLISETTYARVKDKIDCRLVALTKVKGRQQNIGLYTVLDS